MAPVPVAAAVVAAAAAAVLQAEVLVAVSAVSAVEEPLPPTMSRFYSHSPRQHT